MIIESTRVNDAGEPPDEIRPVDSVDCNLWIWHWNSNAYGPDARFVRYQLGDAEPAFLVAGQTKHIENWLAGFESAARIFQGDESS